MCQESERVGKNPLSLGNSIVTYIIAKSDFIFYAFVNLGMAHLRKVGGGCALWYHNAPHHDLLRKIESAQSFCKIVQRDGHPSHDMATGD